MLKLFYFKQYSLAKVHYLIQFNSKIGLYQVLPLGARFDSGEMAIKGFSAFPKSLAIL